ncbi:glycosyltransferase family 1 protein [Bifidobacterium sp. ESL0745]|uniref:glycosyltransferase family 1 protein n=1 Tax=Bifidobacterium sp. ESL0745 TaxID=2983226 RepID=UPI0023F74B3A|nr:glycosyltransferase family 1 protein [Bifidobacterium sp. ESL0745]MDF7665584.1 glycosyltransferase family 1 protein [Bifidobacterium sp. ESL0745]
MKNAPIRVMQVMGHMAGGGVEATIMNHYHFIDKSKVQFDFVIDEDSTVVPRQEIQELGGNVFVVPPYKRLPQYLRSCEQLFAQQKPDIVHSNLNALSVFPLGAAKKAGVPVRIAHNHSIGVMQEGLRTVLKDILRPFSKVFPTHLAACTPATARWLFGEKAVDNHKVFFIKNAIDVDRYSYDLSIREEIRKSLNLKEGQLALGQVGRFCYPKNHLFALEVMKGVVKWHPDAQLFFVGDGELRSQIETKIQELQLGQNVHLLGQRNDVERLYQAFDALLFPSRYEGLPLTVVEAQAAGLPVIMSDVVSDEVDICPNLIHRLSLDNDIDTWIDTVDQVKTGNRQVADLDHFQKAGYEIRDSAQSLCEWYEEIAS